jgi:DNA-binding CsgD family transcriptional regulator
MSCKSTTEQRQQLLNQLPLMLNSIGREGFASAWLKCINELVMVDQFGIFVFDGSLKPKIIARAALPGQEHISAAGAQIYLQHFYYFDPCVSALKAAGDGNPNAVLRMRAADVPNEEYRKQVYERYNIRERISYLGQAGNTWYSVNLFRRAPNDVFSTTDLQLIEEFHAHFIGSVAHHIELVSADIWDAFAPPQLSFLQELVGELGGNLSPREVDVCARALSGMTKIGIALDLDLKAPTVSTLTQRAYRKLNVSSLNEVFALCLRAMALRDYPT